MLVDATRVLARLLTTSKTELPGIVFSFMDHRRRAKRRNLEIMNAKNNEGRKKPCKDLVGITEKTIGYGERCLKSLSLYKASTLIEHGMKDIFIEQLNHYLPLARQVVCQTRRWVLGGEHLLRKR